MKLTTRLLAVLTLIWVSASSFSFLESTYSCSISFVQEDGVTILKESNNTVASDWEIPVGELIFTDDKELTLKSGTLVISPKKGDALFVQVNSNASLVEQLNKIQNNPGFKAGDRIILDNLEFKRTKKDEKESPLVLTIGD